MKSLKELLSESIINEYLGKYNINDVLRYVKLDKDEESTLIELLKHIDTNVEVKANSLGGEILRAISYLILAYEKEDRTIFGGWGLAMYNTCSGAQNFLYRWLPKEVFYKAESKLRYSKFLNDNLKTIIKYLQENPDLFEKSLSRRDNFEALANKINYGVMTPIDDCDEEGI